MAITDAEEIKVLLDIDDSPDDGLIESLIANATAHAETQTERQFEAASATRYYDPTDPAVVDGPYLYLDEDLVSVTTLTNGDSDVLTAATEYILQPVNFGPPYDTVKLIETGGIVWTYEDDPEIAISLLGSWGYQATVPNDVKYAVQLMTAYYYRSREAMPELNRPLIADGVVIAPAVVPAIVKELLDPYRKLY